VQAIAATLAASASWIASCWEYAEPSTKSVVMLLAGRRSSCGVNHAKQRLCAPALPQTVRRRTRCVAVAEGISPEVAGVLVNIALVAAGIGGKAAYDSIRSVTELTDLQNKVASMDKDLAVVIQGLHTKLDKQDSKMNEILIRMDDILERMDECTV